MKNIIILLFLSLAISPLHAIFEYDRAIMQGNKGNWQQSKELLKKVVVDEPDRPDILYDMGVASFKSGDADKALAYFTQAAQRSDTAALQEQAFFNAGNAHVKLNQLRQAIDAYDKVLALNPSHERAKHNKEVVKKMLEQQKQEQEDKEKKEQEQKDKQDQQDQKDQKGNDKQQNEQENNQEKQQENQKQEQQDQKQPEQQQQEKKSEREQQEQQKNQEEKKQQEAEQKQDSSGAQQPSPAQGQEKSESEKKLSPQLARILEDREKKDAQLNKKMIKAMVHNQGESSHDYNCW